MIKVLILVSRVPPGRGAGVNELPLLHHPSITPWHPTSAPANSGSPISGPGFFPAPRAVGERPRTEAPSWRRLCDHEDCLERCQRLAPESRNLNTAEVASANHMNRFVAGDRAPSSPEEAKMLACTHPAFDDPVILFQVGGW